MFVGRSKLELLKKETEFLGLMAGKGGISIVEDRKKVVKEWPTPTNISELGSFIGLLQFFRRFIQNFSETAAPLTNLTRKGKSNNNWDQQCDKAFKALKEKLIKDLIMIPPTGPFLSDGM